MLSVFGCAGSLLLRTKHILTLENKTGEFACKGLFINADSVLRRLSSLNVLKCCRIGGDAKLMEAIMYVL